jgi:hypothetical protein
VHVLAKAKRKKKKPQYTNGYGYSGPFRKKWKDGVGLGGRKMKM